MAIPGPGQKAPAIDAPLLDGNRFSLEEARKRTPVLVAFFKVGCPTCQYTFPFLDRLSHAYPEGAVQVVGVSQDDAGTTRDFNKQFGVSFPVALDDTKSYPASRAYGLTIVPSLFMVSRDGTIEKISEGWAKTDIDQLNQHIAKAAGQAPAALFKPGESVKDFKAG